MRELCWTQEASAVFCLKVPCACSFSSARKTSMYLNQGSGVYEDTSAHKRFANGATYVAWYRYSAVGVGICNRTRKSVAVKRNLLSKAFQTSNYRSMRK